MNHSPKRSWTPLAWTSSLPVRSRLGPNADSRKRKRGGFRAKPGPPAPAYASEPMTCGRALTDAEIELMQAMKEYKESSGRMFPTWSEVLEVSKVWATEGHLSRPA